MGNTHLTIGVIGMGFIGKVFLTHLHEHPEVSKILVATKSKEKGVYARENFKAEIYADYREMITKGRPDAVCICNINSLHTEIARWIIDNHPDIGLLIEKPIGINKKQVDLLLETAKNNDTVILVGHSLRFASAYIRGKEILEEGILGTPTYLEGKYKWFKTYPGWKREKHLCGGGFLLQSGIHIIDALLWYANSPVIKVSGHSEKLYHKNLQIEDSFFAQLFFANGLVAHFIGSSATKGFIDYGLEIYGSEGAAKVESNALPGGLEVENHKISIFGQNSEFSPNGALINPVLPKKDFWKEEISHFINCIYRRETPKIGLEEAKKTMDVCFALYESARQEGKILPLINK